MFYDPANHKKFHRKKRDKFCSRDPYFFCRKASRNGIEPRQDLYLSMRKLSNLSRSFDNLSHDVFFSVDLFFRRGRPVNITGAVAGSPRFHHIKTAKMFFNTPFQITIVRSYRAAMFVMHVDFFKARTMFAPRSRAVKNPFGAFLNEKGCHHPFDVSAY